MKIIITIWPIFLLIIMIISFSACSGGDNNNLSSVSPPLSSESAYTETELSGMDTNSSSSQKDFEEDEENTAEDGLQKVRVDADGGLRMRDGPGTEYDIIRVIPKYEYVDVVKGEEAHTNWIYVYYDGDYGWISTEFILYESDLESTSENGLPSWAKAYSDFLLTYDAVTYTSTMYGGQYLIAGHVVNGEMKGSDLVEFWDINGYDYPVLISREISIDADGKSNVPYFTPTAYIIENSEVVGADESRWSTFFKESSDGPGWDVKGSFVVGFVFKPENGGSPDNVQEALKWLKTK